MHRCPQPSPKTSGPGDPELCGGTTSHPLAQGVGPRQGGTCGLETLSRRHGGMHGGGHCGN